MSTNLALVKLIENVLDLFLRKTDVRLPPARRRIINQPLPLGHLTSQPEAYRDDFATESKQLACILSHQGDCGGQ